MHDRATVAAADIARMAVVGRAAVSNWRRRFGDFPAPVAGTSSNPLFSLAEVEAWLRRQGKIAEIPLDERVWHGLRAGVDDLRLADAVGRVGAFLTTGEAEGDIPEGISDLVRSRGPARTFDFLVERYLETHSRRVAVTPGEVANLMVALAEVADGTVLDPACGSGTLLAAAAAGGATRLYGQERIEIPRIPLHRQRALGAVFGCLDRFEALLGRVASDGTALVGMALQGLGDGLLHPSREQDHKTMERSG